jgi:cytoskeletal protein CcmA (bactofilin family)
MARTDFGEGVGSVASIIAEGCSFNGTINVTGGIRIDGQFEGKVVVTETFVVGKSGKVRAEVETKLATIAGTMNGEVNAKEGVKLQSGSHFEGNIYTKNLVIEEGVYFDGGCWRSREGRPKQAASPAPRPETGVAHEKPVNAVP